MYIARLTLVSVGTSSQLNGFAVWLMSICVGPSLFAGLQLGRIRKTLGRDETLKGCQPIELLAKNF
jgi:hypothetical protein